MVAIMLTVPKMLN